MKRKHIEKMNRNSYRPLIIRRILIAFCFLLASLTMMAGVRIWPGVQTVRQTDGTTLNIIGYGDEDAHYYTTLDGVLVVPEGKNMYIATTDKEGLMTASNLLAHESMLRTSAEKKLAEIQQPEIMISRIMAAGTVTRLRRAGLSNNTTLFPHIGTPKVVVILVNFTDTVFSVANPKAAFNQYLNQKSYYNWQTDPVMDNNYGSVARYFSDMSNGTFVPQFDVVGPVTLSQSSAYYGATENYSALMGDAVEKAKDSLDFSQYDSNNDGNVDAVCVIYAGYPESMNATHTEYFWPKSGTVSLSNTYNGKKICRFAAINELNYGPEISAQHKKKYINGIGLFCHEFSHCLGLPDLYPSSGTTAYMSINQNMDRWDLMDLAEYNNNGYRPCEYTAWERERMGWMTIDTLKDAADVALTPVSEGGKAYRILNDHDATGNEYYMIENIQKRGWNYTGYGHGMLVTHIDYSDNSFVLGSMVNNTAGHPRYHVLAADTMLVPIMFSYNSTPLSSSNVDTTHIAINKLLLAHYGGKIFTNALYQNELAGDPFPGVKGVTELAGMASVYTGNNMDKPITDIQEAADGTITFKFCGGHTNAAISIVTTNSPSSDSYYSLQGVRLQEPPQHGLYIKGGKIWLK